MENKYLTATDVWALFAETDRRIQEADRKAKESQERFDKEMKASREEFDKRMQEMNKRIGGIDEDIGDHAEQYFQNALEESLTFAGEKYDVIIKNMECCSESGGTEFDIVMINSKSLAIIEVKSKIRPKFVKTLSEEKVAKFRKYLPQYGNLKAYLGIAGFSFGKKVLEEAKSRGIGIIRQVGKSIEMSKYSLKPY